MSKSALIIGSSSMLGQRLHEYLDKTGFKVFSCGRSDDDDIHYDLKDLALPHIPVGMKADIIFHCAATFSDDSLAGCLDNEKTNALSSYIINELATAIGCKHLIYAGTISSCYSHHSSSMTSYGASKLRGEDILEWSLSRNKIAFTSLRFPQLYDEYGICCKHQLWLGRIIAYAFAGKNLRMPGGNAKRNFLHVDDAIQLMCAAMEKTTTGRLATTHFESITYERIAQQAYDIFDNKGAHELAPEKQPFREIFIPESSETYKLLNYWPKILMNDGIKMIKLAGSAQKFGPMDVT